MYIIVCEVKFNFFYIKLCFVRDSEEEIIEVKWVQQCEICLMSAVFCGELYVYFLVSISEWFSDFFPN